VRREHQIRQIQSSSLLFRRRLPWAETVQSRLTCVVLGKVGCSSPMIGQPHDSEPHPDLHSAPRIGRGAPQGWPRGAADGGAAPDGIDAKAGEGRGAATPGMLPGEFSGPADMPTAIRVTRKPIFVGRSFVLEPQLPRGSGMLCEASRNASLLRLTGRLRTLTEVLV